jgi:recombination protein RecA
MAIKIKKEKAEKKEKEVGRTVDAVLKELEKKHGKGIIRRYSDKETVAIDVIKTGSYKLDKALGIGGYPRGRIVEVYGPEAAGKTTLALQAIGAAQKDGGLAAFVDAEHALDPVMAIGCGVNMDDLIISQPDNGEQALDVVEHLARSEKFAIIVVDSVSALVPKAEIEGEMGDSHMGLQARLMSQAMRKLTSIVHKSKTCVFFINQLRMKIGVMFGNPETTSGGNALKFYASVRIDIRRTGSVKKGEDIIGNTIKIKVAKNKLAPPYRIIETELIFGKGLNQVGELLDIASGDLEIVERSGAWYSYGDEKLGQGKAVVCEMLNNNPELYERILTDVEMATK